MLAILPPHIYVIQTNQEDWNNFETYMVALQVISSNTLLNKIKINLFNCKSYTQKLSYITQFVFDNRYLFFNYNSAEYEINAIDYDQLLKLETI